MLTRHDESYLLTALQGHINRPQVVSHSRTKIAMNLTLVVTAFTALNTAQGLQGLNYNSCSVLTFSRFDNGYITWISSGKSVWTIYSGGLGPDAETEIGARLIPQEPMVDKLVSHPAFKTDDSIVYYCQPWILTQFRRD